MSLTASEPRLILQRAGLALACLALFAGPGLAEAGLIRITRHTLGEGRSGKVLNGEISNRTGRPLSQLTLEGTLYLGPHAIGAIQATVALEPTVVPPGGRGRFILPFGTAALDRYRLRAVAGSGRGPKSRVVIVGPRPPGPRRAATTLRRPAARPPEPSFTHLALRVPQDAELARPRPALAPPSTPPSSDDLPAALSLGVGGLAGPDTTGLERWPKGPEPALLQGRRAPLLLAATQPHRAPELVPGDHSTALAELLVSARVRLRELEAQALRLPTSPADPLVRYFPLHPPGTLKAYLRYGVDEGREGEVVLRILDEVVEIRTGLPHGGAEIRVRRRSVVSDGTPGSYEGWYRVSVDPWEVRVLERGDASGSWGVQKVLLPSPPNPGRTWETRDEGILWTYTIQGLERVPTPWGALECLVIEGRSGRALVRDYYAPGLGYLGTRRLVGDRWAWIIQLTALEPPGPRTLPRLVQLPWP